MRSAWVVALLLGLAGVAHAGEVGLVDTVVATIGDRPVTLSDLALARALGVLGLEPATGPITETELTAYLDARLAVGEATQLAIEVPAADVDRAWEKAGGAALADRLARAAVDPAWARRILEDDLRVRRFVDLRFRAFAFVTDFDVDEALGPGEHDEATRASTHDRLREDSVARALAAWRQDARRRVVIRRIPGVTGPWPPPFTLEPAPGPR